MLLNFISYILHFWYVWFILRGTLSSFSLLCLQISEKEDEKVCSNLSRYIIKHTLVGPQFSNKQLRNLRLFAVRKSKKSKVSCLDIISSVDWQKFENIRHLACGPLLKKEPVNRLFLFCVALRKIRCDFTSSA